MADQDAGGAGRPIVLAIQVPQHAAPGIWGRCDDQHAAGRAQPGTDGVEDLDIGIEGTAVVRVPIGRFIANHRDVGRASQAAERGGTNLYDDAGAQFDGVEERRRVVEDDRRLPLVGGDDQQHAALAGHEGVLAEPCDIGGQRSLGPALAAAPTDHGNELVDAPVRLPVPTGEFGEQHPLGVRQGLAHGRKQHGAPRVPGRANQRTG